MTYRDAGVDIDAGDALVGRIAKDAARTRRAGADGSLGGFGALFDLKAAGFSDPILVAATDGVGTKLELARQARIYRGLGIDLVAMCANDILAQGAAPLFFLDYYATSTLESDIAADIIAGIADGCLDTGAALIGGETAEMPGVYPKGGFDLAGFCVGAAERGQLLDRSMTAQGQMAIAIASTGVHSNGYSLVRRVLDYGGFSPHDPAPFQPDQTLGEALLTPTALYAKAVMPLIADRKVTSIAHITGGGLVDNPPRVFSDDLALALDMTSWSLPPLFSWLQRVGQIAPMEMLRVFNCGIGMIVTVDAAEAEMAIKTICDAGYQAWQVGTLISRGDGQAVRFDHLDQWKAVE
jgi:phosphoribosylformylglycinamidine cyclo-ligase